MQDRDSFAPMDLSLIKSQKTDADYEEHSPSMGIEKRGKPQDELHTPYMKDRIQRDSSDMSSNASLVKLQKEKTNPLEAQQTLKSEVQKQLSIAESNVPEIQEEDAQGNNTRPFDAISRQKSLVQVQQA